MPATKTDEERTPAKEYPPGHGGAIDVAGPTARAEDVELFYNRTSPYARMVRVAAHESQLLDRIHLREVDPWADPEGFQAIAPLGKVPALLSSEGSLLVESTEICRYLDGLDPVHRLRSTDDDVAARTALAHGAIDCAFAVVVERRRPPSLQWEDWIARQAGAIRRTLPRLVLAPVRFDLGDLTTAVLLAYLDFRLPELDWRSARPELSGSLATANRRASMAATVPA